MGRGRSSQTTAAPARRGELQATVLVVRDPDYSNETTTDGDVTVVDIDLGASFDGIDNMVDELGLDEARETAESWLAETAHLPASHPGRSAVESLIEAADLGIDTTSSKAEPQHHADKPTLVIIRDPDACNEYHGDPGLEVVDFDLGADFDGPQGFQTLAAEEQKAICDEQRARVSHLDPDHPVRLALEEQLMILREY